MNCKIIDTQDGSKTLFLPALDETYHSRFGAVNESRHVFLTNGLAQIEKQEITVCEIGFGTGLNALLSWQYAEYNQLIINYVSFEKHPLSPTLVSQLNYGKQCNAESYFEQIHTCDWNAPIELSEYFKLTKIEGDVLDKNIRFPKNSTIIYFDAFAPKKQQEMWNIDLFSRLYESLITGGLLVTYASAGIVKRALKEARFQIKRLPGPQGKFHMLQARKL